MNTHLHYAGTTVRGLGSDLLDGRVPQSEGSDCVVGQDFGALHRDQETAIFLLNLHRPVLITLPL